MFIEIERKFEITEKDLEIISNRCKLIEKKEIEDIYMDTDNYTLLLNKKVIRIRN
jgi:adenylate cyclase class IV